MKISSSQIIEISPYLLGRAFFEMDDAEQREFFETVAKCFLGADFDNQMYHVTHNGPLSDDALYIMKIIGSNASR